MAHIILSMLGDFQSIHHFPNRTFHSEGSERQCVRFWNKKKLWYWFWKKCPGAQFIAKRKQGNVETILLLLCRHRLYLYLGRVSIQVAWYIWIHCIEVALAKLLSLSTHQWQCRNYYIVIGQTQAAPILR